MTAIITNQFRLNATKEFANDLLNTSNYYLFIGRTEAWPDDSVPTTPADAEYFTKTDAWQRMTAMKKVTATDIKYATPRHQWISQVYSEYDSKDAALESKSYYVISDNNNVYICLKAGPSNSTKSPDLTGVQTAGIIDYTAVDGYIWKYLFSLSVDGATKFLTSAFIPVDHLTTDPGVAADTALRNQWDVQNNAVAGAFYNIKVANAGTGYTSSPTVTVVGDGTGATATATVSGGLLTNIAVINAGSGYNHANIVISGGGGSGASAYAVLPPAGGFGSDPRQELRAHYVTINVNLVYDDGAGDFIVGNDFRQIGLVRNPTDFGTTTVATADTLMATKALVIALGGTFAHDSTIEGTVTGAKGIVDSYDSANGIIKYHQTDATGFTEFSTSDYVRPLGDAGAGQDVTTINNPEVTPYSGEVIFLENRTPITRAGDQIETIKLVLEF
tara:strand:- start:5965 stop:7299 length:1335 start_codon:yes stop_codon:yes gene_type:complete